jgi:hypothetical protein
MIQYGEYQREDGTKCSAVLYSGEAAGGEHIFEIIEILNAANLKARWVPEETLDEWEEYEHPDGYYDVRQIVVPEHIETEANKDRLKPGDYIVMRDGDTYIQDGRTFEAVWTVVNTTLQDLGEFFQRRELEK